jgi:hypothetical protein
LRHAAHEFVVRLTGSVYASGLLGVEVVNRPTSRIGVAIRRCKDRVGCQIGSAMSKKGKSGSRNSQCKPEIVVDKEVWHCTDVAKQS